ncbi:BTAD domain-containing putative transcriptional regulator [Catenulispora yoronensis]|uniref:BTAD domain-containing putative transcriptional regulator n=2 Tax=Catenulispora yoronensis TaxID=450799 RepID=A0ABP5FCQ8_9ACTN
MGPLEVWFGEERIPLTAPPLQRLLAALLVDAGYVVSVDRLTDAMWDADPPDSAVHQIRKAASRLRHTLPDGTGLIETAGSGYRLAVADEQVDLQRFAASVRAAREHVARGEPTAAAAGLRAALALVRGPFLDGARTAYFDAVAVGVEEGRLAALELLHETRLTLGEGAELVGDLRTLVAEHPLRERPRGQLMLALYRAGRQTEALAEFDQFRRQLRDDLGINPGPELAARHAAILREDPRLSVVPQEATRPAEPGVSADGTGEVARSASAGGSAGGPGPAGLGGPIPRSASPASASPASPAPASVPAPDTLPYDVPDFVGRTDELRRIAAVAVAPRSTGARIVAIDGIGGSGKTALAVRAAHEAAPHFPDGRLYIDFAAYTPGQAPAQPGTVVENLLRMLGVPPGELPDDHDLRIARWRRETADRALVVVFDNVLDTAQIRRLLPASPRVLTIVTSRSALLDLDGAVPVPLAELTAAEARSLLGHTLGEDRVAAEPEAAARLAELCDHLPLALRIASARLRNRPRWSLDYMAGRLDDQSGRLAELSAAERSVEATLRSSYDAMDEWSRAALRVLAQHPGRVLDAYATAALLDCALPKAEQTLENLLDTRFLLDLGVGEYGFHDLVRAFGNGLSDEDTAPEDRAAFGRLVAYYRAATDAACHIVFSGWRPLAGTEVPFTGVLPPFDTEPAALEWFDRERAGLIRTVRRAVAAELPTQAVALGRNTVFFLNLRGLFEDYHQVARDALDGARLLNDPALLELCLSNLAVASWKLGRLEEGVALAREGLAAAAETGDLAAEAGCRGSLGLLLTTLGRRSEALPHVERSITLNQEAGRLREAAESWTVLSSLNENRGRTEAAVAAAREAGRIGRELGAVDVEIAALVDEAAAWLNRDGEQWAGVDGSGAEPGSGPGFGTGGSTGPDPEAGPGAESGPSPVPHPTDLAEAARCLDRAAELSDESRLPANIALVLAYTGLVRQLQGETGAAAELADRAQRLVETAGSPVRQAAVANVIGRLHYHSGQYRSALDSFEYAHRKASAIGFRIEAARAENGIARCTDALKHSAAGTAA